MRNVSILLFLTVSILLVGCGKDEPISEAQQKTNELRSKYADKVVGSWWVEQKTEKSQLFEQLELSADGNLSGYVKWCRRSKVMVDGQEVWTDWETLDDGNISGKWMLVWNEDMWEPCMHLQAIVNNDPTYYWYMGRYHFIGVDETTLDLATGYKSPDVKYQRGKSSPSF